MNARHKWTLSENLWSVSLALGALIVLIVLIWVLLAQDRSFIHGLKSQYIGSETCRKCHEKEANSWENTRMAKSFEVLQPNVKRREKLLAHLDPDKDYTHDKNCLPCHTTGYGLVGGFVSIEKTPQMAGVGCESCHGPGGMYAETIMSLKDPTFKTAEVRKTGLIYPPKADVCKTCHNKNSPFVGMNYVFNYEERVKKGSHQHFKLKYEH
ncbi:MAG: hypothetical protein HY537_17900 [Deltaproteobacteria bacterium]|nr:hypothetical protein [Deltaproteobacteria bacterium]